MARKKAASGQIQDLLEERKRLEEWLERLEKAADRTPESVRDRVRADYEARLDAVVAELQGFEDDLRGSLASLQERYEAARVQERKATEELAEAELRYAVGEFRDSEWSERKAGILDRLIGIREDLGQAEEEIGQLEDVLTSISAPRPSGAADVVRPEADDDAEPEIAELDDIEDLDDAAVDAPAPSAEPATASRLSIGAELGLRDLPVKPAAKPQKGQDELGDELAFLKALSDEEPKAKKAAPRTERAPAKPKAVESLSEPQAPPRSRPSVINQRTLKCGECGAMNLPTEWYCDRCGAELASL